MADVHGVVVNEGALGAPPINLPEISNIGIIGTAPGIEGGRFQIPDPENANRGLINYNHPFLITKRGDANADQFGALGTPPDALDGIYDQGRAKVVMVVVEEFEDGGPIDAFEATYAALHGTGSAPAAARNKVHFQEMSVRQALANGATQFSSQRLSRSDANPNGFYGDQQGIVLENVIEETAPSSGTYAVNAFDIATQNLFGNLRK